MGMRAGSDEEPAGVSSSLGEEENVPGGTGLHKHFEFTSCAGP